jgi:hypothetical protein
MRLIAEQDQDLHRSAVEVYVKLLQKPKLPQILLEVGNKFIGQSGVEWLSRGSELSGWDSEAAVCEATCKY